MIMAVSRPGVVGQAFDPRRLVATMLPSSQTLLSPLIPGRPVNWHESPGSNIIRHPFDSLSVTRLVRVYRVLIMSVMQKNGRI